MKRVVDGVEMELEKSGVEIVKHGDRWMVRTPEGTKSALVVKSGDTVHVSYGGRVYVVEKVGSSRTRAGAVGSGDMRAPMPGQIVDLLVDIGQNVLKGEKLLVLEAMKTQQAFVAPFDGVVVSVGAAKGAQVAEGQSLVVVEAAG